MRGLGWFRLVGGQNGAGLVEVAAFVGGDGVECGGEGEAQEFDEGILEADRGEVEIGVEAEEVDHSELGVEKGGGCVGERRRRARLDILGGFAFDFGWWFERANEPGAEKAGKCRAAAKSVVAASRGGDRLHCNEIDFICEREMLKTLGDAPCRGMRAPSGLGFGQVGEERVRVMLYGHECVVEGLDVGFGMHVGCSVALGVARKVPGDFCGKLYFATSEYRRGKFAIAENTEAI